MDHWTLSARPNITVVVVGVACIVEGASKDVQIVSRSAIGQMRSFLMNEPRASERAAAHRLAVPDRRPTRSASHLFSSQICGHPYMSSSDYWLMAEGVRPARDCRTPRRSMGRRRRRSTLHLNGSQFFFHLKGYVRFNLSPNRASK